MKYLFGIILLSMIVVFCTKQEASNEELQKQAQSYLDSYSDEYQKLYYASAEAEWKANTYIIDGDTETEKLVQETGEAFSKFTGSKSVIDTVQYFLASKEKLTPLQVRQFNAILYNAGRNPETAGDVVKDLISANAKQTKDLYGFSFQLNGEEVSTNKIDEVLFKSNDLDERLKAWEASKEVGVVLKDGLENLQSLRNKSVQALGYDDFFAYEASDYGYDTKELREVTQQMIRDVWPLYRELHTWARHELAKRYGQEVPEMLPAHWLPNRWGQEWAPMIEVEGVDLDKSLAQYDKEWIMKKSEEFWVSMGFPNLPQSFWDKSSLYPLPEGADYKKNNHASAWHMNLGEDVRSLMSVEPNTKWWATTLHELGHIYYYMSYTNPDVPLVLRGGANRAYHEGIGTMIGLASMQVPFLQGQGLIDENVEVDKIQFLLKEALDYIVVIPWGAGVMTDFEWELYSNELPKDQYNSKWWELKAKYQGIVPPYDRGEEFCDAASKTHINNDPAQYYDYAMSTVLLFQFHDHIAKNILNQDPHETNYWGSKETGKFLMDLTRPGASVDWKEHLQNSIGSEFSAKPIVDYFSPLMEWLKKENEGREHNLPETI